MEAKRSMHAYVLMWAALTALLSPNLRALDFGDEKNFYFTPDPISSTTPPTGGSHVPTIPIPSHLGSPPKVAHHHPSLTPPTGGGKGPNYPSPPTIAMPSPPPPTDPKSPPFTCTYWKNHPRLVVGVFGWWGSVGSAFGVSSLPEYGEHMDLMQALSNKREDGFGELFRQGTAALLNSMAHAEKFPYTTEQVRECFVAAMASSKKAADAQAKLFKMANEGRIKFGE